MPARKHPKRTASAQLKQSERTRPHRPTAAEKEARVSTVMTMLLSGARRIEICEFARKQWGVTGHHADRYISDATGWIRANAAKTRDEEITEHIGRMDLIFRAAHSSGNYHAAIEAAKDKAKLRGLYPTEKMQHEGGITLHVVYDKPVEVSNVDNDRLDDTPKDTA